MTELPYYVDDPLMDDARRVHRHLTDPEEGPHGKQWYRGSCAGCDWSSRPLDPHAVQEAYDEHMRVVQKAVRERAARTKVERLRLHSSGSVLGTSEHWLTTLLRDIEGHRKEGHAVHQWDITTQAGSPLTLRVIGVMARDVLPEGERRPYLWFYWWNLTGLTGSS